MDQGANALKIWPAALLAALLILSCQGEKSGIDAASPDKRLDKLRSVPYTSLTEEVSSKRSGLVLGDAGSAWPGYNLYCSRISPEAFLLDMNGAVVHTWTYSQAGDPLWDYALLLDEGELIVINKFVSVLKLGRHSNLIWERPCQVHHDIVEKEDGSFYAIQRTTRTYRGVDVRFAEILHLDSDGDTIGRWSTYDHLNEIKQKFDRRSFFDTILDQLLARGDSVKVFASLGKSREMRQIKPGAKFYDYFHLNTITLLPATQLGEKDPRFREGNLLICLRNVNQIAVLDQDSMEILWAWGEGVMEWPHHPTMVENGNILVFDNGVERKYSQVLEIDPVSEEIVWKYVGDPPRSFYSYSKGSAQRLPNGNTLICEGDAGRTFEVTGEGEIVWDWLNPLMEGGRRVQVYRMIRYAPDAVEAWLGK